MANNIYGTEYVANGQLSNEVTRPLFAKLKDQLNQVKRNETVSPVQYMMQSIEGNEKQLNDHNANFAENLESILNQTDLTREQRRAMLISVNENKLVVDPEHLDPVLAAYEKSNLALKEENGSLRRDLTSLTDTVSLLLSDNAKMREYLERKNVDLNNVLETVSEHEGELVQSLRANLNLLSDENRSLNYEISMLKDLRGKDKQSLVHVEEQTLEDKKVSRRVVDDLADANLRNQSLENQMKLLELKLKNLASEADEERSKREIFEKKASTMNSQCPQCRTTMTTGNQVSQDAAVWHSKIQSIKEQERLQQENMYAIGERDELKARITKLEDSLRAKDDAIQVEKNKQSEIQATYQKAQTESTQLKENNGILKRKIAELQRTENSGRIGSINRADVGSDIDKMMLEEENIELKRFIEELKARQSSAYGQLERMNQDLIDELRKENINLKDEIRNLRAKIKILMERKSGPSMTIQPQHNLNISIPNQPVAQENAGLRRHIDSLVSEVKDLQKKLEDARKLPKQSGYFPDDLPDNLSEPTPRRTRGSRGIASIRQRDPSPIDDIVEKINDKKASRGNTPEAVGRYLLQGDPNVIHAGIIRSKPNSMVNRSGIIQPARAAPVVRFDTTKTDSMFPADPFEATEQGMNRNPRIQIDKRSAEGYQPTSLNQNRLYAQGGGMPFYLNNRNEQIYTQQTSERPNIDQSVSSNLRTDPSQISLGYQNELTRGLLSSFKRPGMP